jgi:(2S)-methylsuccinyl-CoA dehydrogenase
MLLARTDPKSTDHRGLSLFVIEKPRSSGHAFDENQDVDDGPGRGRMQGRAIDTIGYRGMHSFEISFQDWWVPGDGLVGETAGEGQGFYLQMEGFENGRLQTAARAVGLMQAAFEAGLAYAQERTVFGRSVFDYQLSKVKLARMAALIQGGRQFSYDVARRMGRGEGTLAASMVKAYVCRAAEWVTREAMQLHGGMGYAEEFAVSRYYADARVLSIFEGADETLCLRVIARRLAEDKLPPT